MSPEHSPTPTSPFTWPLVGFIAHGNMMPERHALVPFPDPNLLFPLPARLSSLRLPLPISRQRIKRHRPGRNRALHAPTGPRCRRDLTHLPRPHSLRIRIREFRSPGRAEGACGVQRSEGEEEVDGEEGAEEDGDGEGGFGLLAVAGEGG